MKKLFLIIIILLFSFTLIACDTNKSIEQADIDNSDLGLVIEKEIELGEERESVILNIDGTEVLVDDNYSFRELYRIIPEFNNNNSGLYSYDIEYRIDDEIPNYTNVNVYNYNEYQDNYQIERTYEVARSKDQNSKHIYKAETYYFNQVDTANLYQFIKHTFEKRLYKNEMSFCGTVVNTFKSNPHTLYSNKNIPTSPERETDLLSMTLKSQRAQKLKILMLFEQFDSFEFEGNTYEFNSYITSNFKIYDNYIVFKEITPFYKGEWIAKSEWYYWYQSCLNNDLLVTQEAYYNISTGKIDHVRVYGKIVDFFHYSRFEPSTIEIDIKLYIHNFKIDEYDKKVSRLVRYIKLKSNNL